MTVFELDGSGLRQTLPLLLEPAAIVLLRSWKFEIWMPSERIYWCLL